MTKSHRILDADLARALRRAKAAANSSGCEICGFLVDNGYFLSLVAVRNKNKAGGGFAFYSSEVRVLQKAVERVGCEIVGTYHSHPYYLAEAGPGDMEGAVDGSYMLILDVTAMEAGLWYTKNGKKRRITIQLLKN